ncbi:MAG: flavodoxin family protein [Candidatus Galacturonibacter soehngenii]|nr:flavodoxin family protein [Candidatus Galacturonibacter soehngenii]
MKKQVLRENIVIISDDSRQNVGKQLYDTLCKQKKEVKYISIGNVNVKPCYNCAGCTYKTYGKCVVQDDGDYIYPKLLNATTWIIVTPLMWGTYSFQTKRVLDKVALIGDRHYYVSKKELVKRMQGNMKKYFAIGIKDECSLEEKETFTSLIKENITIMSVTGEAFVLREDSSQESILQIAREVSK